MKCAWNFQKCTLKFLFLDAQDLPGMGPLPIIEITSEMCLKFPKVHFKIFIFRRSRRARHGAMAYNRNNKWNELKFPKVYFKIFIFRRSRRDGYGAIVFIWNSKWNLFEISKCIFNILNLRCTIFSGYSAMPSMMFLPWKRFEKIEFSFLQVLPFSVNL